MIPAVILAIQNEDDRQYMEWIFLSYQRLIYYYIMDLLHDPWAADDVMQECIVKLIDKIDVLKKLSESKRRNYIITTAKHTSISYRRRESAKEGLPYDEWAEDCVSIRREDDPEALLLHQAEIDQLQFVWDELDERSKFLLSGRYILEQSFEELAQNLGVNPNSVRMMLTRAKRAAIALIKKHEQSGSSTQ